MPFRLEYAKTARGGCNVSSCKKADAKILKGQLKVKLLHLKANAMFGILVDSAGPSGGPWFQWRHWGCVTEKVLASANEDLEEDIGELDGFEDLNDEDQNRVATALAAGHIAEEDAMKLSEEEQRNHEEFLADEARIKELRKEAKENGQTFDLKQTRQRLKDERLVRRKMIYDQVLADAKAAKKAEKESAKRGKKRKKVQDENGEQELEEPMPKRRGRIIHKVKAEEEAKEKPVEKRKRRRTKRMIKTEESSDEIAESAVEVIPKVKPTRRRKGVKAESDGEEEAPAAEIKANMKAVRSGKQLKTEDVMDDSKPLKPTIKANGRTSKRTTNRNKSSS